MNMKAEYRALRVRQHDRTLARSIATVDVPRSGWVHEIRTAIGMTGRQFARRLGVSSQTAAELEDAEAGDRITLARLRRAAEALDCRLVYAFVPRQGSLDAMVRRQAELTATRLVSEVEQTMALEDQRRDSEALRKEIQFRAAELARKPDSHLWETG